jgi:hypothetical protein
LLSIESRTPHINPGWLASRRLGSLVLLLLELQLLLILLILLLLLWLLRQIRLRLRLKLLKLLLELLLSRLCLVELHGQRTKTLTGKGQIIDSGCPMGLQCWGGER